MPRPSPARSPARIAASTRGSTALVASSRTSSRGRPASARARVSRWRWPPERMVPRSPTTVSRPSRQPADEPVGLGQPQRRTTPAASSTPAPVQRHVAAHGVVEHERHLRHQRRPSRRAPRRSARVRRRRRAAPRPAAGSTSRAASAAIVDLPEPVGPTSATVRPGGTVNDDVTQHRLPVLVGEVDVARIQRGRPAGRASVALAVRHVARRPSGPAAPGPSPTTLRGSSAEHPADRPHRERQHREQERHADHLGDVDRTVAQPQAPTSSTAACRCWAVRPAAGRTARATGRPGSSRRAARAALAANRSVSAASRPMVLTTSAPSKLSCAIALSSARNCWAR